MTRAVDLLSGIRGRAGAVFSPCRRYRYCLWRVWDEEASTCLFIGLNPSTADETTDDPTIRRCVGFARAWGYGGVLMGNVYAWRATDPTELWAADEPTGPDNDQHLLAMARAAGQTIAAWGVHGDERCPGRVAEVVATLAPHGSLWCLGRTKAGCPKHPLYLRADTVLEPFGAAV